MNLQDYVFNNNEIENLKIYKKNQENSKLQDRFTAFIMRANGIEIPIICDTIGKDKKTLENWFKVYINKGIDALNTFNYVPKRPSLNENEINELVNWVKNNNPSKLKQIKEYISNHFGVEYTIEAVRKIMKKNGLKVLRPQVKPGKKPSKEEQEEFINEYFDSKTKNTVTLFGDGVHLVHQNIPGLCWGDPKDAPVIETNTGRQRLNILGAYNPDTHKFIHVTDEANCDSEKVIKFFELIINTYSNAERILLILDNAKYFKSKKVNNWLNKNPQLQIKFLPTYAPNLNLIERFWRFAKEKLVKNTYYKEYKTFRAKVFQFFNHVNTYKDELKTLMVEKFEIV